MLTTLLMASLLSANPPTEPELNQPPAQEAAKAAAASVVVHVDGMVCSFCVQGLERGMGKLEGVTRVVLSLEHKTISLWIAPNKELTDATIKKQIRDSGFDVAKILRTKTPSELTQNP